MYKDPAGINRDVTDVRAINHSIRNILETMKGSVPGKPRFGSNLHKLVFKNMDHLTESVARNYVFEALSEFEDRITVRSVSFTRVEEYNRLLIEIVYSYTDDEFNDRQERTSVPFDVS